MKEGKVSIIVPVYNAEKYLVRTIDSILIQEYSKIELILINDGSKDNSSRICNDYEHIDPRVKVIYQENKGVSSARNAGLDNATGEYIGFVDADDIINPDMYKAMVRSMEEFSAQMVMGAYEKVNAATGKRTLVHLPYDEIGKEDVVDKVIYQMAFWNCRKKGEYLQTLYGSTWPNLYRADIIKEHKIRFHENVALGEDMLFNLQYLLEVKRIAFVNKPLYEYYIHPISATRGKRPHMWEQYLILIDHTEKVLGNIYGNDPDFQFNVNMQKIHFATSVIEEQVYADENMSTRQKLKVIKEIVRSPQVNSACKSLNKFKLAKKEWLKILLFRYNLNYVLYEWIKMGALRINE